MAYRNFDEFLIRLEVEGQLQQQHPASIADMLRAVNTPHTAFLIGQPPGADFSLALHPFASAQRMAWALGTDDLQSLTDRLTALLAPPGTHGSSLLARASELVGLLNIGPPSRRDREAQAQAVIVEGVPDLQRLPALRLAGEQAVLYGVQVMIAHDDGQRTYLRDGHIQSATTVTFAELLPGVTTRVPAALVFGGDPAQMWAVSVPLPTALDPYLLAGWVRHKAVRFIPCLTHTLKVPADAEVVVEGWLHHSEGQTCFEAARLTHRHEAVIPALLPADRWWMAKAAERLLLPLVRLLLDHITDISINGETAVVAVTQQPRRALFGLWSTELAHACQVIIAVDASVNPHDANAVAAALDTHVDWTRDVLLVEDDDGQRRIGLDATAHHSV